MLSKVDLLYHFKLISNEKKLNLTKYFDRVDELSKEIDDYKNKIKDLNEQKNLADYFQLQNLELKSAYLKTIDQMNENIKELLTLVKEELKLFENDLNILEKGFIIPLTEFKQIANPEFYVRSVVLHIYSNEKKNIFISSNVKSKEKDFKYLKKRLTEMKYEYASSSEDIMIDTIPTNMAFKTQLLVDVYAQIYDNYYRNQFKTFNIQTPTMSDAEWLIQFLKNKMNFENVEHDTKNVGMVVVSTNP